MTHFPKPLLIYDGDCGFCERWAKRFLRLAKGAVDGAPYQRVAGEFSAIPRAEFEEAVHLIEPDGRVSRGAEAAFRTIAYGRHRSLLWMYQHVPGVAPFSEWIYRCVSRHRSRGSCEAPRK